MAVNTQRTMVWTVQVEADDHDSAPLSDVKEFVRDDIVHRVANEVSRTVKDSLTKKMQEALSEFLGGDGLTNQVEQAIVDNISSEGWSILDIKCEIKEGD